MNRRRFDHGSAQGYGVVGVLMVLLVLGGLAAVALTVLPGSGTNSLRKATSVPGLVTSRPQAQIATAAQAACKANYSALKEAVYLYQVENGALPNSVAQLQPYFRGSLSTPEFTLTIDPNRAGQVEVQTRGHPAAEGDGNCRYA